MNKSNALKKQSGVVLVVSLVILLLLTIIGVTTSQVTSLEEKMAGNMHDQNIAFQAAETGLRGAEAAVVSTVALAAFNGTNGLYGAADTMPYFASTASWDALHSAEFTSGLDQISSEPRYYIKYLYTGAGAGSGGLVVGGYGEGGTAGTAVSYFWVTSMGAGKQLGSKVILRSYFAKKF